MNFEEQLSSYLANPGRFSVLVVGERGTGKSKLVKELGGKHGQNVVVANCASFSDDTMAESELFGHKKGAFTGANENKKGLFEEADNAILFLDEVHNLSKRVQEKVMTALQTESSEPNRGKLSIRPLGESTSKYVTVRPVFASNLSIKELRKSLLPDLYDRISQLVVEIPSIADQKLDLRVEFKKVWEGMAFEKYKELPSSGEFYKWLHAIHLEGNYRTIQNIAINWHQGRLMEHNEEEVFGFVKEQIAKFHSSEREAMTLSTYNFRKGVPKKNMEKEYRLAMYDWAKESYPNFKDAEIAKSLGISRLDILKR